MLNKSVVERLWEKIERDGPVPAHRPELGPCWPWTGHTDQDGYGIISVDGKNRRVPRLVLALSLGRELVEGAQACHHCDNPPCGRPSHLFEDTNGGNTADRHAKGRTAAGERSGARLHPERRARGDRNGTHLHPERVARGDASGRRLHPERYANVEGDQHWTRLHPERVQGTANPASKLTDDQVREIRRRYAAGGTSQPALGREFGVSHVAIGLIVRRRSYAHVD